MGDSSVSSSDSKSLFRYDLSFGSSFGEDPVLASRFILLSCLFRRSMNDNFKSSIIASLLLRSILVALGVADFEFFGKGVKLTRRCYTRSMHRHRH